MAETWSVLKLLQWSEEFFTKKDVDAPRLTAQLLLGHVLKLDKVKLYVNFDRPMEPSELAEYKALIGRRAAGEPVAYILGQRDFYGRLFQVDARVLVPRPETERLVDAVLESVPKDAPRKILDLCTGSCCIAATIAAERPQAKVWASDLSPDALAVAKANVDALGLADRVTLLQGDLFAPLAGLAFDVIVSNPPYIADGVLATLSREVKREPKMALVSGPLGMDHLERIARGAGEHLEPGGLLALEIGDDQGALVPDLLKQCGFSQVRVERDWAQHDRVALGRW
jgi:release factor glutamine methyltransferase